LANSGVESLSSILDNLLELSRHQAGRLTLSKKAVNIAGIIEKTLKKVHEQYLGRHAVLDAPGELPSVTVDPNRLERIVYNLVENAFKYSAEGSDVSAFIRVEKQRLVIGIKDQGQGITPEAQKRLFEPFERLETAGKTRGIGLGLVVCKHLVEAHGGCIWVESKPGEGSSFLFTVLF
jgi:signal transduction histidine kinase